MALLYTISGFLSSPSNRNMRAKQRITSGNDCHRRSLARRARSLRSSRALFRFGEKTMPARFTDVRWQ
jgi:hypothetical protein